MSLRRAYAEELSASPVGYQEGIFHAALGYEEVERIVCFRKKLPSVGEAA